MAANFIPIAEFMQQAEQADTAALVPAPANTGHATLIARHNLVILREVIISHASLRSTWPNLEPRPIPRISPHKDMTLCFVKFQTVVKVERGSFMRFFLLFALFISYCGMLWTLHSVHNVKGGELIIPMLFGLLLLGVASFFLMNRIPHAKGFNSRRGRIVFASCAASFGVMILISLALLPVVSVCSIDMIFFSRFSFLIFISFAVIFYPVMAAKLT